MHRAFIVIALAFVTLIAYLLSNIIPLSGVFADLKPRLVDQCDTVPVAPGTEDVTIDHATHVAIISAADRRWRGDKAAPTNAIYAMDVESPHTVWRISPEMNDFVPHGISLWLGPNGEKRLFVVDHRSDGEFVDIFSVGDHEMLTHLDSISFDAMTSPNDVLAVGPRQFYVTNDRRFKSGIMSLIEAYLALPLSSVAYYDGATGRVIKKSLVYANGINWSPDHSTVYVSELLKRRIAVFKRDPETGALTAIKRIKVKTAPDNIEVARDGALWVAGHSKIFDFLKYAKNAAAIAPSHILRVNPRSGENKDLLIDTTGVINASSVGAVWDKTLIVGSVFDDHVVVCPMVEIFLRPPPAAAN